MGEYRKLPSPCSRGVGGEVFKPSAKAIFIHLIILHYHILLALYIHFLLPKLNILNLQIIKIYKKFYKKPATNYTKALYLFNYLTYSKNINKTGSQK
ncbi:hypothetical protein NIES4071_55770 [Calothrix sp. NIES-4071]|nr:hypothetical protein NIES4071_55770 [Calothrix sp. NIES-4071]BAZ59884.1 hypothetical protein NIES4105_55720 [Calothrix sp. NIES-4105]